MNHRNLDGKQSLLRLFVGEFDKHNGAPLYPAIFEAARKDGLAGCTVLRATEGYGRGKQLHTELVLEGAGEHPVLMEFVDEPTRIGVFLKKIKPMLDGALVTEESVIVHHYQAPRHQTTEVKGNPPMASKASTKKSSEETHQKNDPALSGEQRLLRIYFGESDKVGHTPLHLEILTKARKAGLAGCTTLRGIAGFGASSVVHTDHLFRVSSDLPMILEIVDSAKNVRAFLKEIAPFLKGAMVTEEKVTVHHYG